ncbi:bifunctional helix-turn-helix transcriptional regulator/GNAT family N-acetyltransferase [Kordia sp.]|uniref:bifunctional helix-turn-helix transcriptional regulator/GNAT family N-acetyltransferase n=1 Tax=Kordia sp. TaxID=1965332 RepID=UPI003B5B74C0
MDALREFKEIGLGSRLARLSELIMKEIQKVYDHYNIDFDPYLFPAFKIISLQKRTTNTKIREALQVSQPAITQTINKLNKKGLITIENDETDKRKKVICLSYKGEQLLIKMIPIWNVMYETVQELTTFPSENLINHINHLEDLLADKKMSTFIIQNIETSQLSEICIVPYKEEYETAFYDLNVEWLETFFYVEPHDEEVLSNAKSYIIDKGGYIFFAKIEENIVGTVALMKMDDTVFELGKMAVSPEYRGKKIGQKLLQHCIDFAKSNNFEKLILYSNRKLENAIYIYEKYGFREIPMETNNPYARGNIKMELLINV